VPICAAPVVLHHGSLGMVAFRQLRDEGPVLLQDVRHHQRWNWSSFDGRSVLVNDVAETCWAMPLPARFNGDDYFEVTAGSFDYAHINWWR
jgi:hypothetical protein